MAKKNNFKKKVEPDFDNLKTGVQYDQKLNENLHEEYPDDFQEIQSGDEIDDLYGEDEPNCRLTQKPSPSDLKNVVDEYRKYVSAGPKEYQLANSSHFSELPSKPVT